MDQQTWLLIIMSVFTGVAAVSMLVTAAMTFGMYRSMAELRKRSTQFMDKWEPTAATAQRSVERLTEQTNAILSDVKRLTEKSQVQMERLDDVLSNLQTTTKLQIARVDESLQVNLERLETTASLVNETILRPVKQVRGVVAGLDAVMKHLSSTRRRRPTVDQATLDEEMFI